MARDEYNIDDLDLDSTVEFDADSLGRTIVGQLLDGQLITMDVLIDLKREGLAPNIREIFALFGVDGLPGLNEALGIVAKEKEDPKESSDDTQTDLEEEEPDDDISDTEVPFQENLF